MSLQLKPVPRVRGTDARALVAEHLRRARPVIFEGLIDSWAAVREWSPERLAQRLGGLPVKLFEFTRRDAIASSFARFVEWMERGGAQGPLAGFESLYLAWDATVLEQRPELRADFDFEQLFPRGLGRVHTGFWMGPRGAHTPLHHDLDAPNLHAALHGKKRFVLFSPEESENLYPADVYEWTTVFSEVDLRSPDLSRHPRISRAHGLEAVLSPGDVLFIPVRWWHAVWCLETAVSLNGWWFGPSLLTSLPLWREVGRAALHKAGLYARNRCTCCGHGDLRRHFGWADSPRAEE